MLSRLARAFAAEIRGHDFSDSPYRLDRAGHQRDAESPSKRSDQQLTAEETDFVRANVMFVTAQVLKYLDPNLDLHEYAAACGVPRSITHRTNGSPSGAITYGIRWDHLHDNAAMPPGSPLWEIQMSCNVGNVVVFRRLLEQIEEFDPTLPPVVEPDGGSKRIVTVALRDWDQDAAASRALELVSAASTSVGNGTPAILMHAGPADD